MRSVSRTTAVSLIALITSITSQAQGPKPARSVEAIAASESAIRVYWLKSTDPLVTGYRIYSDGRLAATVNSDSTSFDDTGLPSASTHRYRVCALFGERESAARSCVERTDPGWPASTRDGAKYDLVVVQASSGGVAAAVEAARRGLHVALIEPTTRIGGMPANGLSASDLRRAEHGSGIFVRFTRRVSEIYAGEGIKANGLSYEPRVAHEAMKSLLYETPNVDLFKLAKPVGVVKHTSEDGHTHLDAVTVEQQQRDGKLRRLNFRAPVFIDATDCGDIAAWAGAAFRLGREPRSAREPHNGMIYYDRANDRPLNGSTGKADNRIQAYSYLLTVKDYGKGADKTIPRPAGYRKEDFIHSPAWAQSWAVTSGTMPGSKLELNQHPQGGDIQGINYKYPLSGYAERDRINKLHREHVLCYLYYIQTEQGQKQIGLPDDEYRDTGGFPPLLYVREGRRIIGDQLPDELDVTKAASYARPESVGIGDYPMDSHAVRPKTDWTTPDMGEGEWWLYKQTPVHQLPIGVMTPRDLDNVYVTTAVSSTHVSFGTYRLEPVRMAFGEAAAIATDLGIRFKLNSHRVPARQIQDAMLPHAANLYPDPDIKLSYYTDLPITARHYYEIQYLCARGIKLPGDTFMPDAKVTYHELKLLLTAIAARANRQPSANAYLGNSADLKAVAAVPDSSEIVTRTALAKWLPACLPNQVNTIGRHEHYTDAAEDAETLASMGIDSILWDGVKSVSPVDGKWSFHPDRPLKRSELFAALYIAQIGIGPLFDDHPADIAARR